MKLRDVMQQGLGILIYGRSNTGKTSSLRNLDPKKTFIITWELSQTAAALWHWGWRDWNAEAPTGWLDMRKVLKAVRANPAIDTVVVDTISSYQERLIQEFVQETGKSKDRLGFTLWNVVSDRFTDTLEELLKFPQEGKNVVLLAHLKYKEVEEGDRKKIMRWPSLYGEWPENVSKRVPVCLRTERYKIGKDIEYVFEVCGGLEDYGGDKFHLLDSTEPSDIAAVIKKIQTGLQAAGEPSFQGEENTASQYPSSEPPAAPSAPTRSFTTGVSRRELIKRIYDRITETGQDIGIVRPLIKEKLGAPVSTLTSEQLLEALEIVESGAVQETAKEFQF